jgi:hypothetical protein
LVTLAGIKMEERLAVFTGKFSSSLGSTCEFLAHGKDHSPIAVPSIPLSTLEIVGRGSFLELVLSRDLSILGLSTLWAPSLVGNVVIDGKV